MTSLPNERELEEIFKRYHLNGIGQHGLTSAQARTAILEFIEREITKARKEEILLFLERSDSLSESKYATRRLNALSEGKE